MGAKVPLKNIIDSDTDMLFVNDEPEGILHNAFLVVFLIMNYENCR